MKKWLALLMTLALCALLIPALAEGGVDLDALITEIDAQTLKGAAMDVSPAELTQTLYVGGRAGFLGMVSLNNYGQLEQAREGKPVFSVSEPAKRVGLMLREPRYMEDINGGKIVDVPLYITIDGMDFTENVPATVQGQYDFAVYCTWGDETVIIPITIHILPYEGPALIGPANIPERFEAAVDEVYSLSVLPEPADWAWPGLSLFANVSAPSEVWDHMSVNRDPANQDLGLSLSFDEPGVYSIDISIEAHNENNLQIFAVWKTVKAVIGGALDPETDTAAIHLNAASFEQTVYTGSTDTYLGNLKIENYAALASAFGAEQLSIDKSSVSGPLGLTWYENEPGDYGFSLTVNGQGWSPIPEEAVGEHHLVIRLTWGALTAEVPVTVHALLYDGPVLEGLTVTPSVYKAAVNEAVSLAVAPVPANWAFEGAFLSTYVTMSEDTWSHMRHEQNGMTHVVSFDQDGLYVFEVHLAALGFEVRTTVTAAIGDAPDPTATDRVLFDLSSLEQSLYATGRTKYVGAASIANRQALSATQQGGPVYSTAGGTDRLQLLVDEMDGSGEVRLILVVDGARYSPAPIPAELAGTYKFALNATWGTVSGSLPVTVHIVPYTGPVLTGLTGVPESITAEVNQQVVISVQPVPADWAFEDMSLSADVSAAEDVWNRMSFGRPDPLSVALSFDKPGIYPIEVMLLAGTNVFMVSQPTTVYVGGATPPPPAQPTAEPAAPLALAEHEAVHELSPDGRSIFINKPTITGGTAPYTIAYNCYDADSNPVNYYYSDDARTAMSPGYNGRFNVFVVVRDSAGGQVQIDTGWQDLSGYEPAPLTVAEEVAVSEISPDGRSIFINQPTVSGGTGNYTYAYNCYDADSQPVNYYYSSDPRTAMTPGYAGRFCVFVVVSDGQSSVTINTGWYELKE